MEEEQKNERPRIGFAGLLRDTDSADDSATGIAEGNASGRGNSEAPIETSSGHSGSSSEDIRPRNGQHESSVGEGNRTNQRNAGNVRPAHGTIETGDNVVPVDPGRIPNRGDSGDSEANRSGQQGRVTNPFDPFGLGSMAPQVSHLQRLSETAIESDSETAAPELPPGEPTPKRRGRPPGSKNAKKKEETAAPPPKVEKPPEVTEKDWLVFKEALTTLSELVDEGLWCVGMDTDPELGGMPCFAFEEDEAERVAESFKWIVRKRPEFAKAVLIINETYHHYETGMILGSRFLAIGTHFFQHGINVRWSKRPYIEEMQRMAEEAMRGA